MAREVERLARPKYTRRHATSPEAFQVRASRRTPEKEEERPERGEARRGEAGAAIQEAIRRRRIEWIQAATIDVIPRAPLEFHAISRQGFTDRRTPGACNPLNLAGVL